MTRKLLFVAILIALPILECFAQSNNIFQINIRLQTLFIMDEMMSNNMFNRQNLLCQLKNIKEEDSHIDTLANIITNNKSIYILQFTFHVTYTCDSEDENIVLSTKHGRRGAFHRPTIALVDNKLYRIKGFAYNDKKDLLKSLPYLSRKKINNRLKKLL